MPRFPVHQGQLFSPPLQLPVGAAFLSLRPPCDVLTTRGALQAGSSWRGREILLPTVWVARLALSHRASQCGTASVSCDHAAPGRPAPLALLVSDVGTPLCH